MQLWTSGKNEIKTWDITDGRLLQTYTINEQNVSELIKFNDKFLVGSNFSIEILNVKSEFLGLIKAHDKTVTSIDTNSKSNFVLSTSEDGYYKIHDLRTSSCVVSTDIRISSKRDVNWHPIPIYTGKLLPNDVNILLGDHHGRITKWDLRKPAVCENIFVTLPEKKDEIISIAPSSKENIFFASSIIGYLHRVELELEKDNEITKFGSSKSIEAHKKYILRCKLSLDENLIATCSADWSVKIWDKNLELKHDLAEHRAWVHDCCFTSDAKFIATACSDGSARIWDIDQNIIVRQVGEKDVPLTRVIIVDK